MTFVSTDPCSHQSENIWFTPPEIVKKLGAFDLDVCTVSYRPFDVAAKHLEHDRGVNSLEVPWQGFVWMNPPYGKEIEPFIEKFSNHENGIGLVFSRTGTPWLQKWILEKRGLFFLRKRVAFIDKFGKKGTNAGSDSCFIFNGNEARQRIINSGIEGVFVWHG